MDAATNHTMNLIRIEREHRVVQKTKGGLQSEQPFDVVTARIDADMKKKARDFFVNYGKNGYKQAT